MLQHRNYTVNSIQKGAAAPKDGLSMDDAVLELSLRKHGVVRFTEAGQPIHTKQANLSYSTFFQVVEYACSELAALMLSDPNTQNILPSKLPQ